MAKKLKIIPLLKFARFGMWLHVLETSGRCSLLLFFTKTELSVSGSWGN